MSVDIIVSSIGSVLGLMVCLGCCGAYLRRRKQQTLPTMFQATPMQPVQPMQLMQPMQAMQPIQTIPYFVQSEFAYVPQTLQPPQAPQLQSQQQYTYVNPPPYNPAFISTQGRT